MQAVLTAMQEDEIKYCSWHPAVVQQLLLDLTGVDKVVQVMTTQALDRKNPLRMQENVPLLVQR